jgi:hypothetical protein
LLKASRYLNASLNSHLNFWILGVFFAFSANASPSRTCYVQGEGLDFESTLGIRIQTGRQGAVFKAEERRALNLIAGALPHVFRNMKSVDTLEKMPGPPMPQDSPWGVFMPRRRALYLAETRIRLGANQFNGEFFETTIHELAHALDSHFDDISKTPEWLSLSTWDEQGLGVSKNFVNSNARNDGFEDFAESVYFYLFHADRLLKIAPTKFQFLSSKIFGGEVFTPTALDAKFAAALKDLAGKDLELRRAQLWKDHYYACWILPAR